MPKPTSLNTAKALASGFPLPGVGAIGRLGQDAHLMPQGGGGGGSNGARVCDGVLKVTMVRPLGHETGGAGSVLKVSTKKGKEEKSGCV